MSQLETPSDSFEDRNLVLQALLGLLSVSDAVALTAIAVGQTPVDLQPPDEPLHPLVLVMLGLVSFRDTLRSELDAALGQPGSVWRSAQPWATGADTKQPSEVRRLIEILR